MTHFWGKKIKNHHLCFQSIKNLLPAPSPALLFWSCTDSNSATWFLVIPENSPLSLCVPSPLGFFSIYQQVFLPVHLFRAEFTIVPKICFSNLSAGHAERLWWHQAVPASSSLNWRVNPLQVRLYSPKYLQAGSVFSSLCTASDPWKSRIKIYMRDGGISYKFV